MANSAFISIVLTGSIYYPFCDKQLAYLQLQLVNSVATVCYSSYRLAILAYEGYLNLEQLLILLYSL
jgi:hypothetical protein